MSEAPHTDELPDKMKGPPSGYFIVVPPQSQQDPIDVSAMLNALLSSWLLLCVAFLVGAILAAIISLQLPEKFRAEALISPVAQGESGTAGALRNRFGDVAALAGINLGSSGGRSEESLATFESSGFARDFIVTEDLLPVLFSDRWDAGKGKWKDGYKPPTMEAAVKKFTSDVRTITEDRKTGLVTVSVTWFTPKLAADWANRMVEMVNERLRTDAVRSAERSIEYLNKELVKTSEVELRQAIYRLIQDQVSIAMLANVQREYAFRFIDSAVPPESRASPKRTLMVVSGAFAGLFCGLLIVLFRHWLAGRERGLRQPRVTPTESAVA